MDYVKFFKLWLPVIVWAGFIFFCSGIQDLKTPLRQDFIFRKMAHVTEYFILAFLLHRAILGTFVMDMRMLSFCSGGIAFLYAISDEVHQSFVLGRYCAMSDVAIDMAGIILFYILLKICKVQIGQ